MQIFFPKEDQLKDMKNILDNNYMPLTKKGSKIKEAMEKEYGEEKGEKVFYASQNKGVITGTHKAKALKKKQK